MTVASALVAGNEPLPQLAEAAVAQALASAGLKYASGVLLFLTPEFARHGQATVTAVARAAQCTQVAGGMAVGVFTEAGWVLDRPAAAVMVFGGGLSLGHASGAAPLVSYCGGVFPPAWSAPEVRFGGIFGGAFAGRAESSEPVIWQQSRLAADQRCSVELLGADLEILVSSGLQLIGEAQRIERSQGYDLERLGAYDAVNSLNRALPTALRQRVGQGLHQLAAVLIDEGHSASEALADGHYRALAIIAANVDHSLTLSERVEPGQRLAWAVRQPASAEAEMRRTLAHAKRGTATPAAALVFSCIGRGPYFYGGDDRDLALLRESFPGLPILGVYGAGQIAPVTGGEPSNRAVHNAVVSALIRPHLEKTDV